MSSLLFSSSVAFSRAGGSFCKASSSSSSSSSPSSSRTTTTTKSVRFDFRSPRRRRTTNETTTTTYATTSQNDDGNTKNNSDENMSARELKRKLEELGVDTSDCFEKGDLLRKFEDAKANGGGAREKKAASSRRSDSARAESSSSSSSSTKQKQGKEQPKNDFFENFVKGVKEKVSVDALVSSFRETANRLEVRYGVGAKTNEVVAGVRKSVVDFDKNVGATKFVKNSWPPIRDAYQKGRNTPAGKVANFVFWIWLFSSGIFWTLLYSVALLAFVTNLLFPQFISERVEKMQAQARQRMEEMQRNQYGGMGGPGGMGGMGGMGGQQPPRSNSSGGRKTYGDASNQTIDVDID